MYRLFSLLLLLLVSCRLSAGECQCGIFVLNSIGQAGDEVFTSETFPQACERLEMDQQCHDMCYQKFVDVVLNRGQEMCENLGRDIFFGSLGSFYRWCQVAWKQMSIRTEHFLCCRHTLYVRCIDLESTTITTTTANSGVTSGRTQNDPEVQGATTTTTPAVAVTTTTTSPAINESCQN